MNPTKKKKKSPEFWFAVSALSQAKWEQKQSKCRGKGATETGRNSQIFQIYFEENIQTLENFKERD